MSDTPAPPPAPVPPAAASAALDAAALHALDPAAIERFLRARRWFGAKGRTITAARVAEVVPVAFGAARFAVARVIVDTDAGALASYQVPLAVRGAEDAGEAVLATVRAGGRELALVDATTDARFLAGLGTALSTGGDHAAGGARWTLEPLGPGAADLGLLPARVLGTEQSNTSIVYGERSIVKLFRRLEPGEHPEVEIARFLTTRTAFRNAPALEGTIRLEAGGHAFTAGMRSAFVAHGEDGWAHALDAATRYLRTPGPDRTPGNPYADEARRLGAVTRALHAALASHPDAPGFAVEPVSAADVAAWAARTRAAVRVALDRLAARADTLGGKTTPMARAIAGRGAALEERCDALAQEAGARTAGHVKSRHHGDCHLGQVLRTPEGDWMLLDFEGEPARPLAERRAIRSPLRDVAGMLRSFAYAAATAAAGVGGLGVNALVEIRAAHWERDARAAFLAGYDARADEPLLALFEMEKLLYEVEYELDHRPDWTWIPLRGIAKLF